MEETKPKKSRAALIYAGIILGATAIIVLIAMLAGSLKKVSAGPGSPVSVTSSDVLDILENGETAFLYVGRPTCPNCAVFSPILTEVIEEYDYLVYYYNTDAANDDLELKRKALEATNVTGVPAFLYIENGIIIDRLADRTSKEALLEFFGTHL